MTWDKTEVWMLGPWPSPRRGVVMQVVPMYGPHWPDVATRQKAAKKRQLRFIALRRRGFTYQQIAERYGISNSRAQQIVGRAMRKGF